MPASSSPAVVERPSTPGTRPSNVVGGGPRRRTWFATSQRVLGRDWPTAWLFALPTVALLFGLIGYPVGAIGMAVGLMLSLVSAFRKPRLKENPDTEPK